MADDGDILDKKDPLELFITDVVNWTNGQIQKDLSDVVHGSLTPDHLKFVPIVNRTDIIVRSNEFSNLPNGADSFSTVLTRKGKLNAAALADLFMVYGQRLTSIRKCTMYVGIIDSKVPTIEVIDDPPESSGESITVPCTPQYVARGLCEEGQEEFDLPTEGEAPPDPTEIINPPTNGVTREALWVNQRTALSAQFAMPVDDFRTKVHADPNNPFDALRPGEPASLAAINALIARIKSVIDTWINTSVGDLQVTVCHSSCHQSCHGSRGRR